MAPPPDRSAELAAHESARIRFAGFIDFDAPRPGRLFAGCHFSLSTMHATIVAVLTQLLENISGVPVTPFGAGGAIDEVSLAAVVERMAAQGVQVIVPCGGTGEFSALSAGERDRVARITIEAAGGTPVIVGVGGDVAGAARAAGTAVAAGAAGVMTHALSDPYLTADGTVRYVEQVAAATDGVVVPYIRGRLPSDATLERIVGIPQVVALKWAIPDVQLFAGFAERFGSEIVPICGLAELWAPFFALAGGRGFTSGLVNVDAGLSLALLAALRDGAWAEAMRIWRAIRPFEELRARHDAGNNVPAVKEAMEIAGLISHATVRPPLAPLSPADRAELAHVVRALAPVS
jgi:4-hydroxy-tetrahydrodipicolinate synthase